MKVIRFIHFTCILLLISATSGCNTTSSSRSGYTDWSEWNNVYNRPTETSISWRKKDYRSQGAVNWSTFQFRNNNTFPINLEVVLTPRGVTSMPNPDGHAFGRTFYIAGNGTRQYSFFNMNQLPSHYAVWTRARRADGQAASGPRQVSSQPAMRTWTDRDGRRIEARLISTDGTNIIIERPDGQRFRYSIENLSDADRRYLAERI